MDHQGEDTAQRRQSLSYLRASKRFSVFQQARNGYQMTGMDAAHLPPTRTISLSPFSSCPL